MSDRYHALPVAEEIGPDVFVYRGAADRQLCVDTVRAMLSRPDRGQIANRTPYGSSVYRDALIVDAKSDPHPTTDPVVRSLESLVNSVCWDHFHNLHGIPVDSWGWEVPWIELCHYKAGSRGCDPHMDGAPGVHPVILTVLVYLNTLAEGEGGTTYFLRHKTTYQPREGDVLVFPPGYTHTHGSTEPLRDRFLVNTRILWRPPRSPSTLDRTRPSLG